ncbi:hypothetical protein AB1Y20_008675 [Prymnesium parvum]|uniref:Uncharacterized protein n=1 Tax=Prymnesium parvum TaxID=97485 RepID=A0AB34IS73_PRYPA
MALFVVVKGYHVGSKWFEEAFNQVEGGHFRFEFEHCLKAVSKEVDTPSSLNLTLRYLRSSCGCDTMPSCAGCVATPLPPPEHSSTDGAHRKRSHEAALGRAAEQQPQQNSSRGCRASGVSFAASSDQYTRLLAKVLGMAPSVRMVVHLRSNHVKHALSFLRHSCPGQQNHLASSDVARLGSAPSHPLRLRIPPALFLSKAFTVAQQQLLLVDRAKRASEGRIAYTLVYEAMQQDLVGEIERLLLAIGATLPAKKLVLVRRVEV